MCSVHQLFCFCAVWFLNFPFFSQMLAASVYDKILPISQSTLRETVWQSGPTASSWGRVVPTQVGRQRGDSPPATMAKSMEMGLSLFTRAPLCLPLLRPCLLPCLHPSSCFSHPSLQTHRHRLQSGRQLTLDLLGHWSLQFSVEDGKKPHSVSTPASTILSLKQIPKGNYPEPRGAD